MVALVLENQMHGIKLTVSEKYVVSDLINGLDASLKTEIASILIVVYIMVLQIFNELNAHLQIVIQSLKRNLMLLRR